MLKHRPALVAVAGVFYAASMALILTVISCQPASLADVPSHHPLCLGQEYHCSCGGDHLAVPPGPPKNGRLAIFDVDDRETPAVHRPVPAGQPADDSSIAPPVPYTRLMRVTAYCACKQCCGRKAAGITASGLKVTANRKRFVSADPGVPMAARLIIPGYAGGRPVLVLDRGVAIHGNRLDIFIPSHKAAQRWGVKWLEVTFLPRPATDSRGLELARGGRD